MLNYWLTVKIVAIGLFAGILGVARAATCVTDGSPIEVSGVITLEAFPGRPNYESVERGDELELVYVLTSEVPRDICFVSPESGKIASLGLQHRFQLARAQDSRAISPVVFGRATVHGKVEVGMTGHYHTPAAIDVSTLANAGGWSPAGEGGKRGLLPVTVAFRPARLGHSIVGVIKNETRQPLRVAAKMENPTGKTRTVSVTIEPFRSREIGYVEGWPFSAGDRLVLHEDSFADVTAVVP